MCGLHHGRQEAVRNPVRKTCVTTAQKDVLPGTPDRPPALDFCRLLMFSSGFKSNSWFNRWSEQSAHDLLASGHGPTSVPGQGWDNVIFSESLIGGYMLGPVSFWPTADLTFYFKMYHYFTVFEEKHKSALWNQCLFLSRNQSHTQLGAARLCCHSQLMPLKLPFHALFLPLTLKP